MRHVPIIYILVLVLSLTRAAQAEVQKSKVIKLEAVDLGETEIEPNPEQPDVQRKRDSGYPYNKPSRISSYPRVRFQANQPRDQIASRIPGQLSKPFTRYGLPNHSTATYGYRAQQHRNKLQHHVSQQQSISYDVGPTQQEVPSPIRNADFANANSIASQNNEPFGIHTANYLPPQNQKLPAYSSTDSFTPQSYSPPSPSGHGLVQSTRSQSQNLVEHQNHQISDAALFLSQNAQAIQQLYGAPASNQDFAPSYDQIQDTGNQIHNPNGQFGHAEGTSPSPQEFASALPPYASGTLNPQETLEQIQSLEKDRLIVQLQQALAQAQSSPSAETAGRYAQNQASFIQNQQLLASISQQMKSHVSTTPQTVAFAGGNTAFSQSPFLPGTTVNPLDFPLSYGVPTTAQTPTTTTTVPAAPTRPPQSSGGDGTTQVTSSLPAPNQPGSPVGIPIYGGFVPTFITGTNFVPSYSSSVFTSGPVRPAQPSGSSLTHFGIPIPELSQKPTTGPAASIPTTTTAVSGSPNQPGFALAPAITPVVLPVQPIRPVATPLHPIVTPLHPVLPASPAQVHPAQATPAVTSSGVQHSYGLQTALINPALYKPVKAVYPVYYYSNLAYQLQRPAVPSYPWSYAPSYAQAKPAQIWK
ncbi:wiskott-Aldrich syndrome protein homolog 1-like [Odontomachus brunneus]|uniref:wiskott-Aldrich syndrome protein homolog 1-like n=1 Tax=Odontomachus brunneus TaxID=486640 RepID=UPI0013F2307B|nr:wiskott-Aldrich syndrome protein homolog 1-like [Odontomachus brunneus]